MTLKEIQSFEETYRKNPNWAEIFDTCVAKVNPSFYGEFKSVMSLEVYDSDSSDSDSSVESVSQDYWKKNC